MNCTLNATTLTLLLLFRALPATPAEAPHPLASRASGAPSLNRRTRELNVALVDAARSGDAATVRLLLAQGADPNAPGEESSPLFWSSALGDVESVKLLLHHGADPNLLCTYGGRPIDYAAPDGDADIVEMLLAFMPKLPRAKAHAYMKLAINVQLDKDVESRTLSDVEASVADGADVNTLDGSDSAGVGSPLMRATFRESLPIMRFLLSHGARVDLRDRRGRTALMYTGRTNMYYNIVMHDLGTIPGETPPPARLTPEPTLLLLNHGAQVLAQDKEGKTPLMYAAQGNPQAAAVLIAHGATVSARDHTGRTALIWAAAMRDERSIAILLAHGARLNAQDSEGETALMLASVMPDAPAIADLSSRRKALDILQRAGANVSLKDKDGKTANDYAMMKDNDFVSAS